MYVRHTHELFGTLTASIMCSVRLRAGEGSI